MKKSLILGFCFLFAFACAGEVNLLERYPTTLTAGDTRPDRARPWQFGDADVFRVSHFKFEVGTELRLETGPADLGIGHCADGAVWAVLIPRTNGTLIRQRTNEETIAHIWLRFHPAEINRLFPPETVFPDGATNLLFQMRAIAGTKFRSSWHAGMNAMIPEPKDMTVDVDTKGGLRRFFEVDTAAATAEYVAAFEKQSVRLPPAFDRELARQAFDQLWQAYDRDYAMFVLRPKVDWARLRDEYRPKALACTSTYEFATVCADMLRHLRDLHIWMTVASIDVPVFNRPRTANANPRAAPTLLGRVHDSGRSVRWAVTTNQVGYLAIEGWSDRSIPQQVDEALEHMRGTRGLIVDVRLNGGGSEPLAKKVAGRFVDREFVYAYSQFRNGPAHTNLTKKFERTVAPRGPWRYNRPVILLIGQKCMSSNESFIGMMTGDPELTTMGDHTCGSSGNPRMLRLPLDITVSVPRWIDYLPDGTPLDGRGFQPQIPFKPGPGAFDGHRDDLLAAALARLDQAALPDQPIEGPAFEPGVSDLPNHSLEMKAEAADASRPKVVSVTPTNDASGVSAVTEIRIRFDRPMDPLSLKLEWDAGGFLDCDFPRYDPDRFEFMIPIRLVPGALQQIVLNQPFGVGHDRAKIRRDFPHDGFQSADQRLAGVFAWRFRTRPMPTTANHSAPRVTAITPAPGATVPQRLFLEIHFDQPMASPKQALPRLVTDSEAERINMSSWIDYDPDRRTFRIPVEFPANKKVEFDLAGFKSAAGIPANPLRLQYTVSEQEFSPADRERIDKGAREPSLLELLASFKKKRLALKSIAERVQDLTMSQRDGVFVRLQSQRATFRWQQPNQYYADVTDPMLMGNAFRIGSDGQHWWWHHASADATNLSVCPVADMQEQNICICDPFDLTTEPPKVAAAELGLNLADTAGGSASHGAVIESWRNSDGFPVRWRIDTRTGFPAEIDQYFSGFVLRARFFYDTINQPLPLKDFAVPEFEGIPATGPKPIEAGYTRRFINLRDGSDGNMSVRWGQKGPGRRSSSGLN